MFTLEDYLPCQGENTPKIDDALYREVDRVDLQYLPEGTIVLFKGIHPASNYVIEVLGPTTDPERKVKLWYAGTSGPACFIGPKSGCFITQASNLASTSLENIVCNKRPSECILEREGQYVLPLFCWDQEGKLYPNYMQSRIEAYMKIRIPINLKE